MGQEDQNQSSTVSQPRLPAKVSDDGITRSVQTSGSTAAEQVAEQARAEIQGAMVLAKKFPRDEETSRVSIIASCKNLKFAEKSIYKKPVGKIKDAKGAWVQNYVEGPSIRFAEEMIRHWGNVKTQEFIIWEDAERRVVRVVCYDLQSNTAYSEDLIVEKTVERKNAIGREVLRERFNSYNEKISIVLATEDEIRNKEKALVSKAIRNNGLRLIPAHIIEEALEVARKVLKEGVNKDPMAERRKMLDSFVNIGITPKQLQEYLKHPVEQITAEEMLELKEIYNSIRDGEAKWADYLVTDVEPSTPTTETAKVDPAVAKSWEELEKGIEAGDPAKHTDVKAQQKAGGK